MFEEQEPLITRYMNMNQSQFRNVLEAKIGDYVMWHHTQDPLMVAAVQLLFRIQREHPTMPQHMIIQIVTDHMLDMEPEQYNDFICMLAEMGMLEEK